MIKLEEYKIKCSSEETDFEELAYKYFLAMEGIDLIKCRSNSAILKKYEITFEPGIPDFCYEKDNLIHFIEIKSETDSLRISQFKWMINHPEQDIRVIVIKMQPFKENDEVFWIDKLSLIFRERAEQELIDIVNRMKFKYGENSDIAKRYESKL